MNLSGPLAGVYLLDQSAAIPFKIDEYGAIHVLLVTSRTRRRWIVPKGKVGPRLLPSRSAEREAFEEAGVLGRVTKDPVGSYEQSERPNGLGRKIVIQAFALEVVDELTVWQEMDQRERRWFRVREAARVVRDPEIRRLLQGFERSIIRAGRGRGQGS